MSGILGLYVYQPIDHAALQACVVPDAEPGWPARQLEFTRAGQFALGRTHLGVRNGSPRAESEAVGPDYVLAGHCIDDSTGTLRWSPDKLSSLRQMAELHDLAGLAAFNGTFQSAHVSKDGRTLTLINDRFGLLPLFIYECAPQFAFASDLVQLQQLVRTATGDSDFRFVLDRASLLEWLEVGLVMGNRTLLRNVAVLPPASVMTWNGNRSSLTRYWRPQFSEANAPFDITGRGEALDAALRRSLKRCLSADKRVSVSLSGGLDSRLLLGAALRAGRAVSALTFGPERSDDHAIAAQVAASLGVAHHPFIDRPDAAAACFDLGVRRTAGMVNVLDLWGLQHGPRIHDTTDILVNGIGGNELLGFLAFDLWRFNLPRSTDYLTRWLIRKLNPGWRNTDLALVRESVAPDTPPLSERIGAFWQECPARSPFARVYHFFFEEKSRKSNALGVATDNCFAESVAPFLDYDVADITLQIPPRQRMLARFYRTFFRTHYPALANIPYSRTGLSVDASAVQVLARKFAHRVSGIRTPSTWALWLSRDLSGYVQEKLLDRSSPFAGCLPASLVNDRLSALSAGDTSATMAVGQLLTLESFLRQFRPSL